MDAKLCIEVSGARALGALQQRVGAGSSLRARCVLGSGASSVLLGETESVCVPASRAPHATLRWQHPVACILRAHQLGALKAHRPPIKVELVTDTGAVLGYVLLELKRVLGAKYAPSEWCRLQSSAVSKPTPELNVAFRTSMVDAKESEEIGSAAKSSNAQGVVDDEYDDESEYADEFEKAEESNAEKSPDASTQVNTEQCALPSSPVATIVAAAGAPNMQHADHPLSHSRSLLTRSNDAVPVNELHSYRVSIDLRSIRDLKAPASVSLRYLYPLFDELSSHPTSTSVETDPPVQVSVESESLIPNSFSSFEFCASPALLKRAFREDPLVVEVLQHEQQSGARCSLGFASLDFSRVLNAPAQAANSSSVLRSFDAYIPVFAKTDGSDEHSPANMVASIRAIVFLEDSGQISVELADASAEEPSVNELVSNELLEGRGSHAYHVAWELEMWKRREQEQFLQKLSDEESRRLAKLDQEWTKQVEEKEKRLSQRQKDVTKLEKKLEQALFDVRSQEKVLRLQEQELQHQREAMEREFELQKQEAAAAVRRIKREQQHECELQVKEKKVLQTRLLELEDSYDRVCDDFREYKKKLEQSSVGKIQSELLESQQEVSSCRSEIERLKVKESRQAAQLAACIRELARLRKAREQDERERIQSERLNLQRLRVQILARQQQHDIHRDRNELQSIRQDLHKLLRSPCENSASENRYAFDGNARSHQITPTDVQEESDPELNRLRREKSDLLRTGVYTDSHSLILEINERIHQLEKLNGRSKSPSVQQNRTDLFGKHI